MHCLWSRLFLACVGLVVVACSDPKSPALSPSPPPKASPPAWGVTESRVTFAAVGDVLMHQAVKETAMDAAKRGFGNQGYDFLWGELREMLSSVDIAFANLETPVAPKSSIGTGAFLFNADPVMLQSLQTLGIDLVSFANNHAYDQGRKGLIETMGELRKTQLDFIGAGDTCASAKTAIIKEVKGIKIGFIGASAVFNNQLNAAENEACVNVFERESALASVINARAAGAEFIVYSLHGGTEYKTAPSAQLIEDVHALMEAGVDVFLGHHPHVLQPVEVYATRDHRYAAAIYSLGNFVSNQSRYYLHSITPSEVGNPRDGVIFRFSATRKNYGIGKSRIELAQVSVQPTWTENNCVARERGDTKEHLIRVVTNDQRIGEAQAEIAKFTDENTTIAQKKLLQLYEERKQAAAAILGEDWLYRPPL